MAKTNWVPIAVFSLENHTREKCEKLEAEGIRYDLRTKATRYGWSQITLYVAESRRHDALELIYPYGLVLEEVGDDDFYMSECPFCSSSSVKEDPESSIFKDFLMALFTRGAQSRCNREWLCRSCEGRWTTFLRPKF